MAMNENSDIDLAIARVQMAIAESDLRAANNKLRSVTKSRTNYGSRNNQTKAFKPNGITMPSVASPRSTERKAQTSKGSPRAAERMTSKSSPRVTERNKTKAPKKDTSWKTAGIWPALTSPEAKKFRDTFSKKGLLPALRGK